MTTIIEAFAEQLFAREDVRRSPAPAVPGGGAPLQNGSLDKHEVSVDSTLMRKLDDDAVSAAIDPALPAANDTLPVPPIVAPAPPIGRTRDSTEPGAF